MPWRALNSWTRSGSLVTRVSGTRNPTWPISWAWYGFDRFDIVAVARFITRPGASSIQVPTAWCQLRHLETVSSPAARTSGSRRQSVSRV